MANAIAVFRFKLKLKRDKDRRVGDQLGKSSLGKTPAASIGPFMNFEIRQVDINLISRNHESSSALSGLPR
jgi:hypothetical protein